MKDSTAIALLLALQIGICAYVAVGTAGWTWLALGLTAANFAFVWAVMLLAFWLADKLD